MYDRLDTTVPTHCCAFAYLVRWLHYTVQYYHTLYHHYTTACPDSLPPSGYRHPQAGNPPCLYLSILTALYTRRVAFALKAGRLNRWCPLLPPATPPGF